MNVSGPFSAAWSMVSVAVRRMWSRRLMTGLLLVGLTLAAAIPAAIPMYGDAATARVLSEQEFESTNYRPPFSYLYWYSAGLERPVSWADVSDADQLLSDRLNEQRLPSTFTTSFVDTEPFEVRAPGDDDVDALTDLGARSFGALDDFADRTELAAGRYPEVRADGVIEAVVAASGDDDSPIAVGDTIVAIDPRLAADDPDRSVDVEIVGAWLAIDPADERWIMLPDNLARRLMVDRPVITDQLSPTHPDVISNAAWYTILDASGLTTDDVGPLLAEARATTLTAQRLLPGVEVVQSPEAGLREFEHQTDTLTRRLTAYSTPTLALLLLFVVLLVALAADDRRGELAVLHSRGATRRRLLVQIGVEATIVAVVALALAIPLARWIARTMGRSTTFLELSPEAPPLEVAMSRPVWLALGSVLIGAIVLQVVPSVRAAGATIASHDERPTATSRPWWQRSGLDLAVIAVAALAVFQFVGRNPESTASIVDDPLLVVLPSVAALAVGLLVLRVAPSLIGLLARILGRGSGTVALIAARRAARSPGSTNVPLLLLIVTVGSAVFTASLARTLDVQLYDEEYHRIGADWVAQEYNSAVLPTIDGTPVPRNLAPLDEFRSVPGVAAVTRVGEYSASIEPAEGGRAGENVRFVGVDPAGFAAIGFYRDDYAGQVAIPDLMEVLTEVPEGVVVSSDLGLDVGDRLDLTTTMAGDRVTTSAVVVGEADNFAKTFPDDAPFVVGSLDHLFIEVSDPGGYRVWMELDDDLDVDQLARVRADIGAVRPLAVNESPLETVLDVQTQPARQGAFGVLTAGFIASLIVSMLGFFFASVHEVRRATAELGTLQALGLPPRKVAGVVVLELGVLMAIGTFAGVMTGSVLANQLIGRMLGDSALTATPTLIVEIDQLTRWAVVGLIGLLFVAISIVLVWVLRHMRVFQALKMGETR